MFRWLWRKLRQLWRRESVIYLGGTFTNAPEGAKIATWNGTEWGADEAHRGLSDRGGG
jgi:hypothetical protein